MEARRRAANTANVEDEFHKIDMINYDFIYWIIHDYASA